MNNKNYKQKHIIPIIPKLPGIYVFKNKNNELIYIGKAKCLYKRVNSYFKNQRADWKIQELLKEYTHIEYIVTKSEIEALLLEAQLINNYKPKYNVLLKTGNPFVYFLITEQINDQLPLLKLAKNKKEKGIYFGPFLCKQQVRSIYEYLMRKLALRICSMRINQGCLDYHLQRCAGSCIATFNKEEYKIRLLLAKQLLEGNYQACDLLLKEQIKIHNQRFEFEKSRNLNNCLQDLVPIFETLKTGFTQAKYSKNITSITTDIAYKVDQPKRALEDLQVLLKLEHKPIKIDCFDISHFQSSYLVGSCIRFTYGIPDKNSFRKFRIKSITEQNDYAALQEIVLRRYKNIKDLPDLILIDGGKGQLNAVKSLFPQVLFISLAKREETLYTPLHPEGIKLEIKTILGQLIIALRDYAHHFAISYHKKLRDRNIN